jgi:hypothetical protein
MKIAAGIVEYGDAEGLFRCLASLGLDQENGIDLAIVVHSRFANFDLPNLTAQQALDETRNILWKFPLSKVKLMVPAPSAFITTQIESRNLYLKTAAEEECDWLLVIDSDEFIARNADWKEFRKQLEFVMSLGLPHQIFDIQCEGMVAMYRGPRPRLFYRPATIKYWKKHFWFVREEESICYKGVGDAGRVIGGIYLMHDRTIRSAAHFNATLKYNDWQTENEH